MSTRQRGWRGRPSLAVLAAITIAVACADLGSSPDGAVALDFEGIPYPSVLTGDSLRDSLGAAAPLRAVAYNSRGAVIANAPFRYFALDTGVTIDTAGYLRATRRDGTVRVIASVGNLQSADRTIRITRRPDTVFATSATRDTFRYAFPDVATNLTPEMRLSLQSRDTAGVGPGVPGWLVRWRVVHHGDTLAAGDTTLVAVQTADGRRSGLDTTAADGTSARRLRIFAGRLTFPTDSFVIVGDVKFHGAPVPGSPIRFTAVVVPPVP